MLNYNPSQLTDNVTLLEEFHKIQSYLTEHPLYQQYGSQAIYQAGKTDYSLDTVIKPEGSKLGVGDVVIFSNVYYGIVTAVSETTFTIETAVNFRGTQGEPGTPGKDGTNGKDGANGKDGTNGKDGYSTFVAAVDEPLSSGIIQVSTTGYQNIKLGDRFILLSEYTFQQELYTQIGFGTVTYLTDTTADVSYSHTAVQDTKGTPGKDGCSTYLYDGALSESVTSIDKSHVATPTGRFVHPKDIIISTFESTFGAMAGVVAVNDTIAAVNFIGTLQGGGASDYNVLANIPVINQDLSASGFTPVANTYYRHTGATTDTFTQGVIYLYDTAYHKLGESGGPTLNKYTYTANLQSPTPAILNTVNEIVSTAIKYAGSMEVKAILSDGKNVNLYGEVLLGSNYYGYSGVLYSTTNYIAPIYIENIGTSINVIGCGIKNGAISNINSTSSITLTVIYYNDTEIT